MAEYVLVCCETHELRDFLFARHGAALPLAPADNRRCRCAELGRWPGMACQRIATGEDVLCDWCRVTDHAEYLERALRDPLAAEYYQQRGVPGYAAQGAGGGGSFQFAVSEFRYEQLSARGVTAEQAARYIAEKYGPPVVRTGYGSQAPLMPSPGGLGMDIPAATTAEEWWGKVHARLMRDAGPPPG